MSKIVFGEEDMYKTLKKFREYVDKIRIVADDMEGFINVTTISYYGTKIFGIGLSRTGTVSLTDALKTLGYDTIHAPIPIFLPGLAETIKRHHAFTDSQIALQYKELDKLFPNSKFILTVRPVEKWLRSYETFLLENPVQAISNQLHIYLYGIKEFNRRKFRQGFIKHNKEVKEYFKNRPRDLLVMDFSKGDGWEKLCYFLNRCIPKKPVSWSDNVTYVPEFPHQNKSKVI